MSTRDSFFADFELLLEEIPETFTLEQWQFAYKQVILTMGLRIFGKFSRDALGALPGTPVSDPCPPRWNALYQGGGPVIHLAIAVNELNCPQSPTPPS
jgi:hypothetical protein